MSLGDACHATFFAAFLKWSVYKQFLFFLVHRVLDEKQSVCTDSHGWKLQGEMPVLPPDSARPFQHSRSFIGFMIKKERKKRVELLEVYEA